MIDMGDIVPHQLQINQKYYINIKMRETMLFNSRHKS
jgi:hypothetical protein